ncbi:M24 family metallopeptidase [Eisenibacter elegans]|jgi:methionine aminopeptidase|uniref:M24 family metallopeptidase n=1 Tax=Eisenibacter elegans TaxID=997 RepID=UPI0004105AFF|nr:M24 family metallopeptidase [Eisenibacter elegans]
MSINKESELVGMKAVSDVVAYTLKEMKNYARPGMSTKQLDDFGAGILKDFGAHSAPFKTYQFPGWTCISVGQEFCHGIPSARRVLQEGDLINIDVSAELNGFWSDNGASFVLGQDRRNRQQFKKNAVVAIETFIATDSNYAVVLNDGWTMVGNKGGYMAQHEHTIVVTDGQPIILTDKNEIWA